MRKLLQGNNLIVLLAILAGILISVLFIRVPLPTILLPSEPIPGLTILGFPITNSFLATLVADLTVLLVGLLAVRGMKEVPEGLQNIFETVYEIFDNMVSDIAGRDNGRRWLPMFMTILLFLLVANWWELVPGVDSVGIIEPLEKSYVETGGSVRTGSAKGAFLGLPSILVPEGGRPIALSTEQQDAVLHDAEQAEAQGEEYHGPQEGAGSGGYTLLPFLRTATTDLNLPFALALISVGLSQIIGLRKLRGRYVRRFFLPVFTGNKGIDGFVGLLELISEFAKIISLSFRLFGNLFAGAVLLFVMPFLVAFLLPLPFYALEVFVGFMQAFVFAILTVIFFEQATHSHAGDEHH